MVKIIIFLMILAMLCGTPQENNPDDGDTEEPTKPMIEIVLDKDSLTVNVNTATVSNSEKDFCVN